MVSDGSNISKTTLIFLVTLFSITKTIFEVENLIKKFDRH